MTEPSDDFTIRRVSSRDLHELRRRVLRSNDPTKSVADARDEEPTARHYAGFLGERLVVSASFFPSTAPVNAELVTYQLRYMATDFDVQGRGYGALVLDYAQRELRELGAQQLWANGRDSALGFYLRTGWTALEGSGHLSPETQLAHTVILKTLL
ncbi:MAG TPA: GNAT family N-acetyltransferase [Acidimicrobiales bacterium]